MTTFTIEETSPFTVQIFSDGMLRCFFQRNENGQPWESYEQAKAWALQRAEQGVADGWPPIDPALLPQGGQP